VRLGVGYDLKAHVTGKWDEDSLRVPMGGNIMW